MEVSALCMWMDGAIIITRQLVVQTINECVDANEEYIHWMDVIQREKWVFPEGRKGKKIPNPSPL